MLCRGPKNQASNDQEPAPLKARQIPGQIETRIFPTVPGGIDEWLAALNQKNRRRDHGSYNAEGSQWSQRTNDQQDATMTFPSY